MSAPVPGEAPIVLRGRKVVGGCAEGEALVTRQTISGWGGIDPMTGTIIADVLPKGLNAGWHEYGLLLRTQQRLINTYMYATVTLAPRSDQETANATRRSQELVEAARAVFGQRWRREWLPEAQRHLAYWRTFDLAGASLPLLAAHWDETLARIRRLYVLQFIVTVPFLTAMAAATLTSGKSQAFRSATFSK